MLAIRVHEQGDADRLILENIPAPLPDDGWSMVRVRYAGINYTEIYQRSGVTGMAVPFTPGSEGVGVIVRSGSFPAGTRVGWVAHPGAYAEDAAVPDHRLVALPDDVTDEVAAAVLLQGMTAQYLAEDSYAARPGDTALVHAAAGGVGLLLTQVLVAGGVTVIGTTSTDAKAILARKAGAAHVIRYDGRDVASAVRAICPDGVHVVYDSVGRTTWDASLRSVRRRGVLVLYGHAGGKVAPVDPMVLARHGSLTLTRPLIGDFIATHDALRRRARRLFGWLRDGTIRPSITRIYALADVAQAHRDLESRRTSGKLLLRVGH